jgi:2-oxoglutarate dehydrogenase E2 component (dihydrolipoamide succinyltransferase)
VTIDVRVPDSGTITGIKVKEGDTVTPGTVVATLTKGDAPPKTEEAPAEPTAEEPKKEAPKKEAPPPPKEDKKAAAAPPPPKPATPPPPKAAQPAHHETPQLVPKERERRVSLCRFGHSFVP